MTETGGPPPPRQQETAPERRPARYRIVHLSDPQLTAGALPGSAAEVLDGLLHDARFVDGVDLVVVSGDVVVDGSSTAYAAARRRVGAFAALHDAPHVYAIGDRDDHAGFAEVLGSGHLGPDDLDVGEAGPDGGGRGWVSRVGGLRVVTLDTTVPGVRHGQIGEAQRQWLSEVLREPAPDGTVLVLHHPPVSPASHRHLASAALREPDRLAEVVAGTDVVVVLAGHLGLQMSGMMAGVPVLVAPGVAGRVDLTSPEHLDRTVRGAGACVVELGGPFSPRSHTIWARDARAGEQLELRDPASGRTVPTEDPLEPVASTPTTPVATLSDRIPQGEAPSPGPQAGSADRWPQELDSSTRTVESDAPDPADQPERAAPVWLEDEDEDRTHPSTRSTAGVESPGDEADLVPSLPTALVGQPPAAKARTASGTVAAPLPLPAPSPTARTVPTQVDKHPAAGLTYEPAAHDDDTATWFPDFGDAEAAHPDEAPRVPVDDVPTGWAPEPELRTGPVPVVTERAPAPPPSQWADEAETTVLQAVAPIAEPAEGERDDDSGVLSWAFSDDEADGADEDRAQVDSER